MTDSTWNKPTPIHKPQSAETRGESVPWEATTDMKLFAAAYARQFTITNRIITGRTDLDVKIVGQSNRYDSSGGEVGLVPASMSQSDVDTREELAKATATVRSSVVPVPSFQMDGKHVYWGDAWLTYWLHNDRDFLVMGLIAANLHESLHFLYSPHPTSARKALDAYAGSCHRGDDKLIAMAMTSSSNGIGDWASEQSGMKKYMQHIPAMTAFNMLEDSRIEALGELRFPGFGIKMAAFSADVLARTLRTLTNDLGISVRAYLARVKTPAPDVEPIVDAYVRLAHLQGALLCIARPVLRNSALFQAAWAGTGLPQSDIAQYTDLYDKVLKVPLLADWFNSARNGKHTLVSLSLLLRSMMWRDAKFPSSPSNFFYQPDMESASSLGGTAHDEDHDDSDADERDENAEVTQAEDGEDALDRRNEECADLAGDAGDEGDEDGEDGESDFDGDKSFDGADDSEGDEDPEEIEGDASGNGADGVATNTEDFTPTELDLLEETARIIEDAKYDCAEELQRVHAQARSIAFGPDTEFPAGERITKPAAPSALARKMVGQLNTEFRKLTAEVEPGWEREQQSGRFNVTSYMQSQGRSFDVFDRWDEGKEYETSMEVVVIVDASGSMSNSLITQAAEAAWVIKNTVEGVGSKCSVISFNTGWQRLYGVNERVNQNTILVPVPDNSTEATSPVEAALSKLEYSSAAHKLIVLLTDGSLDSPMGTTQVVLDAKARFKFDSILYELLTKSASGTISAAPSAGWNKQQAGKPTHRWYGFNRHVALPNMTGLTTIVSEYVRDILRNRR